MNLVKDTADKVALYLPFESILNMSLSNKKFYGWIWENFDFWKGKFHYNYAREVKIIIFYYKTLYSVITKKEHLNLIHLTYYPDLQKFLQKFLSGACEYTFMRGFQRGEKCGKLGQRYYSQYFCNQCIKKSVVKMQIQESEKQFNMRKRKF